MSDVVAAAAPVRRVFMVSPRQAGEMLSVDVSTVRRYIKAGVLKATRLSRKTIRIQVADIEALLEARQL